jgi:hypothetical protein
MLKYKNPGILNFLPIFLKLYVFYGHSLLGLIVEPQNNESRVGHLHPKSFRKKLN